MKIRTGFVSNSSSSSFVAHADIGAVCKSMLATVLEDWVEWATDKKEIKEAKAASKKYKANLTKALKNKDVKMGKIGIMIPSTNYDTYILQGENLCYVDTCRNHVWDLDFPTSDHGGDDSNPAIDALKGKKFIAVANGKLCESDQLSI